MGVGTAIYKYLIIQPRAHDVKNAGVASALKKSLSAQAEVWSKEHQSTTQYQRSYLHIITLNACFQRHISKYD